MPLPPFSTWVQRREVKIPDADRLIPLIAASNGISRGEIGAAIKLDREVLDALLAGLVRVGVLTAVDQGGLRVYRAV